jgi:hypothetical protein
MLAHAAGVSGSSDGLSAVEIEIGEDTSAVVFRDASYGERRAGRMLRSPTSS